ncbi:MAG TPA: cell division protein FtsQ/DivIB [Amnibacterium sp.]|jgi:cell division protein FtsQ|nr:cell division protein FtsQ/DivIB [Amnibacterium sp.]
MLRADRARIRSTSRARRRAEAAEVRRFTRGARRRRIVAAAAGGFLVVSVATPVLLAVSPAFAVRTITVTGADAGLAGRVRSALAPEVGVPIALVDGGDVTTRIAAVAGVRSFSLERLPPGTLAVRVVPRTAVAQVRSGGAFALVDAAGVTLRTSAVRIGGTPLVTAAPGSRAFGAAAAVIESLPATLAPRVRTVAASTPDDVRLTLADGRLVVWGGASGGAEKAAALAAALVGVAKSAHRIDVSVPGSVSVG